MPRTVPSGEEVLTWFEKYSNWGRWGPDDQLGTMNFITPEKRVRAARLVTEGLSVSCARPIEFAPSADYPGTTFSPAKRFTERHVDDREGINGNGDWLAIGLHGGARTHIDSPNHMYGVDNGKRLYNGFPASSATSHEDPKLGPILLSDGVFTRGVLLDIAGLRGKDWLDEGEAIYPEDLDAAADAEGVVVEEGDALLVRTGHTRRRLEKPLPYGSWPGLHVTCIPWLYERRVAMLGTDSAHDVTLGGFDGKSLRSGYPGIGLPVHRLGLVAMGFWLVDQCNHEVLKEMCRERNRWEFLFSLAPLKVPSVTGMPINPIAVF